jgi:hypothetical protein
MSVTSLISVALLVALASTLPLRTQAAVVVAAPHRTNMLNKLTPAQFKARENNYSLNIASVNA